MFLRRVMLLLPACAFPLFAAMPGDGPPLNTPAAAYLDTVEGICRVLASFQNDDGAVIDPWLQMEHQYSTPYFAAAVGVLLHEGRAPDLKDAGIRAVERTMVAIAGGHATIPDGHGEFFLAPLASIVTHYETVVSRETMDRWRKVARKPIDEIIEGRGVKINNWRSYAMHGEAARAQAGLADRQETESFLIDAWRYRTQQERIVNDRHNLYQDWNGDPQSHAVEAVGRVNLLALGAQGGALDGLNDALRTGTAYTLRLQDPTGQCPPNGRTDNHVFNDVLYCLAFHMMAARTDDVALRGQYLRAARLSFQSIARWKESDGDRAGAFFVTKNRFDPGERVGYQPASQFTNYNATIALHLAEAYAYAKEQQDWEERPAPSEVGGFVLESDPAFGSVTANAGGLQVFLNLRGDSVPKYGDYWTPLGAVRFSKKNWDSRLGPPDGHYDARERRGVSFAPAWKEGSKWVHLSERARDYRGVLTVDRSEGDTVLFHVLYAPVTGVGGPTFYHYFYLTPQAVRATLVSPNDVEFGVTLPVLTDDGTALDVTARARYVTTHYPGGTDAQSFYAMDDGGRIETDGDALRSAVGWIQPYLQTSDTGSVTTLIYPQRGGEPAVQDIAAKAADWE